LGSFLLSPILANNSWRLALLGLLLAITWAAPLPFRVWRRQLAWVAVLSLLAFFFAAFAPDALGVTPKPVRQTVTAPAYGLLVVSAPATTRSSPHLGSAGSAPQRDSQLKTFDWGTLATEKPYRYQLLSVQLLGRKFAVSRRSLSLAIRFSTLIFTLLYSTNFFLLTTAPEEIAEAIEYCCSPLRRFQVPVTEIVLTLTLSLRFMPLVLEEVQNIVRAVRTRDIHWQTLGYKGAVRLVLQLVERVLQNLLQRAEQTAAAMQVRGFISPDRVVQWHVLKMQAIDWLVLAGVGLLWLGRFLAFQQ
jgi:energy-coupling factor transport system permease protein